MKYTTQYTAKSAWHQLYYGLIYNKLSTYISVFFLVLTLPGLVLISLLDSELRINYWLAALPYIFLALVGLLYIVAYKANTRLLAGADGKVMHNFELSESKVRLTAGKTLDLTFEKPDMRSSKQFEHGVYVKHKKSDFMIPLPEDKKNEIVAFLKKSGWLV